MNAASLSTPNRALARIAGVGILGTFAAVMLEHGLAQSIGGSSLYAVRDAATVAAFYAHPSLRNIYWLCSPLVLLFVAFAVSFRAWANSIRRTLAADVLLVFMLLEAPLLMAHVGLQVAMVDFATTGHSETVLALFGVSDAVYNDGLEGVEVVWMAAFAIAVFRSGAAPRWIGIWAGLASAGLLFNVVARWLVLPESALMPTYAVFGLWMVAAGVNLLIGRAPAAVAQPEPA